MEPNKKFGLIISKSVAKVNMKSNCVFNSDSDEEAEKNKRPKIPQKKIEPKKKIKTETVEDASIYEYDNIYDDMKAKQAESVAPKEKKNSRYIETLLKAADKRKKEYERRVEKKIQVEREKEGDKYKDKESFVTLSYKKKIQEMEEEEERERRENMINDMMDVTKQKDLSGFYRHFLKQTVGEESIPVFGEQQRKKEILSPDRGEMASEFDKNTSKIDSICDQVNVDRDSDGIEIDSDSESDSNKCNKKKYPENNSTDSNSENDKFDDKSGKPKELFKRQFRKHHSKKKLVAVQNESSVTSDSEVESNDKENLKVHEETDTYKETSKKQKHNESNVCDVHISSDDALDETKSKNISVSSNSISAEKLKRIDKCDRKEFNKKNIFAKRTVGNIFSEAQARYFQRIANRSSLA